MQQHISSVIMDIPFDLILRKRLSLGMIPQNPSVGKTTNLKFLGSELGHYG